MPSQNEVDELDLLLAAAAEDDTIKIITSLTANNESSSVRPPQLKDDNQFEQAFTSTATESCNLLINLPSTSQTVTKTNSIIEKEFDSSDEEDVQNFLQQKYNEYGRDINKKIKSDNIEKKEAQIAREVDKNIMKNDPHSLFGKNKPRVGNMESNSSSISTTVNSKKLDPSRSFKSINKPDISSNIFTKKNLENAIFTDPIFGLRIINPLISSSVLIERMSGRKPVTLSALKYHLECVDLTQDWVVAGVILNKSPIKTTKTGASYSIWKLSDLKGDIKTFSMFLFKNAHKDLWKTSTGMCIAILNPGVFDNRDENIDVACLTIDIPQKVMILGQSKDMGNCKAKKKNGENCTAIVNLGDCDYCIYHVKQEFSNMSKRSELQSSTAGRGLQQLRNKILGKNEVFYGGQSYTAIPAKKSAKLIAKDQHRMQTLSEYFNSPNSSNINHTASPKLSTTDIPYAVRTGIKSKVASNIELKTKQRVKDLERLKLLRDEAEKFQTNIKEVNSPSTSKGIIGNIIENINNSDSTTSSKSNFTNSSSTSSPNIMEKLKHSKFPSSINKTPTLSKDTFTIDLNYHSKKDALAKIKAMKAIEKKPIEKPNPNFIKYRGTTNGKKRVMEELNDYYNNSVKRCKIDAERKEYERKSRLQKIIDATSSNSHLIEIRQLDEQNKYFNKMEKKRSHGRENVKYISNCL